MVTIKLCKATVGEIDNSKINTFHMQEKKASHENEIKLRI